MSKEQCVNKKLHPYYKTGIYGWFGEEIDDNDYILCPICGEVLGMNYCDYAGEQGYYNQCPKCKQKLDYSEIYDFEDTLYFRQLVEIKDDQLALTEKALELACEEVNRVEAKFGSAYIRANGYLVDYFKTKAKEKINESL